MASSAARLKRKSRGACQSKQAGYKGEAKSRPKLPFAGEAEGMGDFSYRISPCALLIDVVEVVTPFCEYCGGVLGAVLEYAHGVTRSMDLLPWLEPYALVLWGSGLVLGVYGIE
jgi:hypothetical protein